MTLKEEALIAMINEYLAKTDVLVSTHKFLTQLKDVLLSPEDQEEDVRSPEAIKEDLILDLVDKVFPEEATEKQIQISCDASIKNNPGGPSSVGVIIRVPGQKESIQVAQVTKATTNNQAEYDAIYTGLTTLLNIFNRPKHHVVVYSDSQLIINQLRGKSTCKDKQLQKRRDFILEVVKEIEAGVSFEWRGRNSTEDLKNANYLAQDKLGVKRH